MSRRALLLLVLGSLALLPNVARAQEGATTSTVIVVKVDGSIDRTVDGYLRRAIAEAETERAVVVLQLDSAGTLDVDPVSLARRVREATVPVIVWVGPQPAKAQGAALLLLYAASDAAVSPGVGVGPLAPLDLAGGPGLDAVAAQRVATAFMEERGRELPSPVIGLFPREPVPAQEALDRRIASFAATSITELLRELDGRTVHTPDGPVTLATRVATEEGEPRVDVRFVDLGPVDRTLHAAASPTWIYVLLVLALAALAFEITQPGFGFAGFSGLGMLALAVYGLTVVPFSWLGLALLLAGIVAMTTDVVLRRLGTVTFAGLAAFTAGSVLVFAEVADQIDVSPWLIGGTTIAALLYWGFGLTVAIQSRERITSTQAGLVGLVGETRGELKPEGPVYVKGTMWRGRSTDGPIAPGTRVRVRGVDGLILRVQPEPPQTGST